MLGYAWQQGLVPISFEAIMRAVELNGAAIEMNKQAFAWGRLAVVNPVAVAEAAGVIHNTQTEAERVPHNLQILPPGEWETSEWASPSAVSYTHLDVYKRQIWTCCRRWNTWAWMNRPAPTSASACTRSA